MSAFRGDQMQLQPTYRDTPLAGSGTTQFALPKPARMQQVPPTSYVQTGRYRSDRCRVLEAFDHEKRNSAQRLCDELCRAPIAGAVDSSPRPHGELQPAAVLDRSGKNAGTRTIRRPVSCRCTRRL